MPIQIPATTLGATYQSFAEGGLYASGYLLVANGNIDLVIKYGTKTGQAGSTIIPQLGSGQYELVAPAHNLIIGLQARSSSGIISVPAQVIQGQLFEPTIPGVIPVGSGVIQQESVAITAKHNGTPVGLEAALNFIDSNGAPWTIADNPGAQQIDITALRTIIAAQMTGAPTTTNPGGPVAMVNAPAAAFNGQRVRLRAVFGVNANVQGTVAQFWFGEGGATLTGVSNVQVAGPNGGGNNTQVVIEHVLTPVAGSHTYQVLWNTTGTITADFNNFTVGWFTAEYA